MVLEYVNGGELFDKIVRILPLNCKLVSDVGVYRTQYLIHAGIEG